MTVHVFPRGRQPFNCSRIVNDHVREYRVTNPTGRSFLSYRRSRASEAAQLIAGQKERGIPTWQDIENLNSEPAEEEIRNILASDEIANVVLWVTPDAGKSTMITTVEVPGAVDRHRRGDEFFILIAAAGGLTYQDINSLVGSHIGVTDLGNWNIARVESDPANEADIRRLCNRILNQRLEIIQKCMPVDDPLRLNINTRESTGHPPEVALNIDWTHRFAGQQRRLASAEDWQMRLLPALADVVSSIQQNVHGRKIIASGLISLPAATALGFNFMATKGIDMAWEQFLPGGSNQIWSLGADQTDTGYLVTDTPGQTDAEDLAVMVSLNADVESAVAASRESTGAFRAYIHVRSPELPGFLNSAGDALDVARRTINAARAARRKYQTRGRVHLFMAVPAGLAMLIGQLLNTLGPVQTYEHMPVDSIGRYERAVELGAVLDL